MYETCTTYDFLPGMDQEAYLTFVKSAVGNMLQAPGLVELRSQRNVLGSPQLRLTLVWQSLNDWVNFNESGGGKTLAATMLTFTTNTKTEIWGPSPVLPEPLRPGGK